MLPKLIDNQTGQYLYNTLKQCHETRIVAYSWVFNASIVCIFVIMTCIILYICFTKKKTPEEQKLQLVQEQKYILEKIRALKEQKQNYFQEGSLTHLPVSKVNGPLHLS